MMNNIIVPSDFGQGPINAVGFAALLAKENRWVNKIGHVYRAFDAGLQNLQRNKIDREAANENAASHMAAVMKKVLKW